LATSCASGEEVGFGFQPGVGRKEVAAAASHCAAEVRAMAMVRNARKIIAMSEGGVEGTIGALSTNNICKCTLFALLHVNIECITGSPQ